MIYATHRGTLCTIFTSCWGDPKLDGLLNRPSAHTLAATTMRRQIASLEANTKKFQRQRHHQVPVHFLFRGIYRQYYFLGTAYIICYGMKPP